MNIINDKILDGLLKTWFSLFIKDTSINKLFDLDTYFLGDEVFALQETILTYIGIPEEKGISMLDGEPFYRDWYHEQFYDCGMVKITINQLKRILIEDSQLFVIAPKLLNHDKTLISFDK
jgi:hypothetical protein